MLLTGYKYLFYCLYKFWETAPSRWWSEWKAEVSMLALKIWIILSMGIYIQVLTGRRIIPSNPFDISIVLVVSFFIFISWRLLNYKDRWKDIIKEFDMLPVRVNKKYTFMTWLFIFGVIANFIFSIYLLSQTGISNVLSSNKHTQYYFAPHTLNGVLW